MYFLKIILLLLFFFYRLVCHNLPQKHLNDISSYGGRYQYYRTNGLFDAWFKASHRNQYNHHSRDTQIFELFIIVANYRR